MGARAAFRQAQRRKATVAAEQIAVRQEAEQLLALRQSLAADAELAALLGGVRDSFAARSCAAFAAPVPDLSRL